MSKFRRQNTGVDRIDVDASGGADVDGRTWDAVGANANRRTGQREASGPEWRDAGIDPAGLDDDVPPKKKSDRKTLQLCGQVDRALAGCLAASPDLLLNQLTVFAVTAKAGSAALEVAVCPAIPGVELDPRDVLPRLRANQGRLQSEVSQVITRKYSPKLTFRMASPEERAAMQQPSVADEDPDLLKMAQSTGEQPE